MNLTKIVLEIIKNNPEIGRAKFDRIYYSKVEYDNNWVPIIKDLKSRGYIESDILKITQKGIEYLQQHSEE